MHRIERATIYTTLAILAVAVLSQRSSLTPAAGTINLPLSASIHIQL